MPGEDGFFALVPCLGYNRIPMPDKHPEDLQCRLATLQPEALELARFSTLETLLERAVNLACHHLDASYAAIGVVNEAGELLRFFAAPNPHFTTPEEAGMPQGLGVINPLLHSTTPVRVSNQDEHSGSGAFPAGHLEMTSFLCMSIYSNGQLCGQVYLADKLNATGFSADDEALLEQLVAYIAIGISNARQFQEIRDRDLILIRRNADLALLNDLASTLASARDVNEILDKALSNVMANERIVIGETFVVNETGHTFELVHTRGDIEGGLWQKKRFELGEGPVGQAAQSGSPQIRENFTGNTPWIRDEINRTCLRQVACFPFPGRSGCMGVLTIATCRDKILDEQDITLYTAVGSWVGTAIDNARLVSQSRRLAILEERERIGMDLHDGVIQSIYAVGLTLEHARLLMPDQPAQASSRIDQAIDDLNHTIRDIRAYILDLRPRQLNEENLMDGVKRLADEFKVNTGVQVELTGPTDGYHKLPQVQALALFHICQEALANIAKHARANLVNVNLWNSADRILLEVSDDGRGFDPQNTRMTLGHGLANIQTRARNVGGDVEISSEPGDGTTILAWAPYRE